MTPWCQDQLQPWGHVAWMLMECVVRLSQNLIKSCWTDIPLMSCISIRRSSRRGRGPWASWASACHLVAVAVAHRSPSLLKLNLEMEMEEEEEDCGLRWAHRQRRGERVRGASGWAVSPGEGRCCMHRTTLGFQLSGAPWGATMHTGTFRTSNPSPSWAPGGGEIDIRSARTQHRLYSWQNVANEQRVEFSLQVQRPRLWCKKTSITWWALVDYGNMPKKRVDGPHKDAKIRCAKKAKTTGHVKMQNRWWQGVWRW